MQLLESFSPGKIIITGEHSVVYGQPALLASIGLGITAQLAEGEGGSGEGWSKFSDALRKDPYLANIYRVFVESVASLGDQEWWINTSSDLPEKSGLGSSAAYAHAVLEVLHQAVSITTTPDQMFKLVWQAENFKHGKSSGGDPAAVVYGGLLEFRKTGGRPQIQRLQTSLADLGFVLIDSGPAMELTKEMIQKANLLNKPKTLNRLGKISQRIIEDIKLGRVNKDLIKENQTLLSSFGLVGNRARRMIKTIKNAGGVAKISGAGGVREGSGWLLTWHQDPTRLEVLSRNCNWNFIKL